MKSRLGINPEIEWNSEKGHKIVFTSKLYADFSGTVEVGDPYLGVGDPPQNEPSSPGDKISLDDDHNYLYEIRELYLRTFLFDNVLTIGKQQIAWGQADGVTVLDIVNPLRYDEFILNDLEEARIPLWTINYVVQFDSFDLQLLWILDQTYSDFPNDNSEYSITSTQFRPRYTSPSPATFEVRPLNKPSRLIADSDVGLELATFYKGWDLSFNYMYHYSDNPVFPRYIDYSSEIPNIIVADTYMRTNTFGVNATTSFGDYVLRTEWAYTTNRYAIDYDQYDTDGLLDTGEFRYAIGMDYYGLGSSTVSAQIYQSHLIDHRETISRDQDQFIYSILYQKDAFSQTLNTEVQMFYFQDNKDSLFRVNSSYKINDTFTVELGIDIFDGKEVGFFGQFDKSDRVYFEIISQF